MELITKKSILIIAPSLIAESLSLKLTSLDKKRILSQASKCVKSEPKKTDIPQPNEGKKAQPKGKGKIEKGGQKGKVG